MPGYKVFIEDHLLPVVVRSIFTLYEFRSAWNFFRTNITQCRGQFGDHDLWIAAMDRIQGHRSTNAIESLRYILEMIEHLPGLDVKALLDKVVNDLMLQGIEPRHHYDCLFSLRQLKRLQVLTDDPLSSAAKA